MALAKTEVQGEEVAPWWPADPGDLDVTLAEVKQMWWFLDGSIMAVHVRHHLWRSWGFCPRHTWLQAVADCELRWRPMSTAVLYEDLTGRAAHTLCGPGRVTPRRVRRLRPKESCFPCDYVLATRSDGDGRFGDSRQRVNRRQRTVDRLLETRDGWERRSCPVCLGGDGPVCRPHLLRGVDPGEDLPDVLAELAGRLRYLVKSMTWKGPTPKPETEAALVESLGWFAGWGFPVAAIDAAHKRPKKGRH